MTKFNMFSFSAALFLLILCAFNQGIASKFDESELYSVYPKLMREKRESATIFAKNQYESVPQNETSNDSQKAIQTAASSNISSIVPYNTDNRPILGVNGTGQRKFTDVQLSQTSKAIVSDTNKTVLGAANGSNGIINNDETTETSDEKLIDNVDVSTNDTIREIEKNNYTINFTNDHHEYYNSSIYVDKTEAGRVWDLFKNISFNSMLSDSHRRAMTVELSFTFPFYGHPIKNVTVATGGFLYIGDYVHSWLAATQYIAPLMANFDTSLSNESFVRIQDNGTALTVVWEKASLQDRQDLGKFTFSATLHNNGNIVFIYYLIPIDINAIQDDKHPVKVGLSDAYIIDRTVYNARRKTIYEYHRVNLSSIGISNATIIYLKALPTCLDYADCVACSNHKTSFDCAWCPILNRCSTGTDRKKQDWQEKGCDRIQIVDESSCQSIEQKVNDDAKQKNYSNHNNGAPNNTSENVPNSSSNSNNIPIEGNAESEHPSKANNGNVTPAHDDEHVVKAQKEALQARTEPKSMGLAIGFLVPICLVLSVLLWALYAYRNPHTKSGQLLIQYRPTQWSWRRGEARYTAATIHM